MRIPREPTSTRDEVTMSCSGTESLCFVGTAFARTAAMCYKSVARKGGSVRKNRKIPARPRAVQYVFGIVLLSGACLSLFARQGGVSAPGKETSRQAVSTIPKDVDPNSGFRLPLPKRDDLDDLGKKMYDMYAGPDSHSIAGLRGPAGIRLYSPLEAEHESQHNHYLRFDAGFNGRIRELAILVSAREVDSQFEWAAHEPAARQEGLDPKIIEIVKYRRSTSGLPETETVVIQLGRQMFGQKKVAPDTFARALRLFGPRGLVNLVSLMGDYSATAALLTAFDMQLPPGQKAPLPPR